MKALALGFCAVVVLGACVRGSSGSGNVEVNSVDAGIPDAGPGNPGVDAGPADAGPADAGLIDAGLPDAGPADAGRVDAGQPDAGLVDAGLPDAGPADAGQTDGGPADGGGDGGTLGFGGPGPWPMQNVTYGQNDGIQETPIVGMSTDETQNLWVATHAAVYLRRPTDLKFTRYDVKSGLHMAGNNTKYCDSSNFLDAQGRAAGLPEPDKACPIYGAADNSGISEIVGGGPNEVFVGYNGTHNWNDQNDGTWADPLRHTGMLDRVKVKPDQTLQIDRLQMVAGNSVAFWHNRDVMRLVYDHFKHPHDLYVGTNHGIDKMTPDAFVAQAATFEGEVTNPSQTYPWLSDHLHPQVCSCGPCPDKTEGSLLLGDWRGLAVTANGNLLVGGRWGAGKILWDAINGSADQKSGWYQRNNLAYEFAMGDGYGGGCTSGRPVFCVSREGDVVAISAVTETPNDGLQWFASGSYGTQPDQLCSDQVAYKGQKNVGDRDLGVASYDPKTGQFAYYTAADVGLADPNVRDMMALPDGRIVFASHRNGLAIWNPKTKLIVPMNASTRHLPDDAVERIELDLMVSPPILHVSTNSGATSIRLPK